MRRILNSTKLNRASALAVAASAMMIIASADGSGAAAQALEPVATQEPTLPTVSEPVIQQLPGADGADVAPAASLADLVAEQPQPAELSRELNCLAAAIYHEAKGETLNGQLAVGRVIVARSKSGRFPDSYCGVVFQPSQFSFVRGNSLPGGARNARQWKNAVAVAQIAHEGTWRSPVEGALFFHAAYVSPGWRLTRMARVDNHVFYR
ncbi:cell wall hydrolase [Novosphingobium ginsenosidimutans]|uniref:Cell wall hydrolase n=1 Tax=Novosphingobium ginsenosidimutans TaxID=1176536 RepID=A0A5B8S3N2_9SPHN|nr:cell wall hydrolase [Novosphingobium ginsenosidimutans]QEA15738.1 cell wall hydrolase [Novosphingobium ginsenosidimutans]